MTRRLAVVTAAVLTLLVGPAVAAQAGPRPEAVPYAHRGDDHDDWWCVAVDIVDVGYCQGDPLPDRLPLPERPRLSQQ